MNSTNNSRDPMEKLVFTATMNRRPSATAHDSRLQVVEVKNGFSVKNARMPPS